MKYYGFKSIAKFPRSNLKNLGFANGMAQVIQSLFANGEQGFAFDFNDLSTMFQDAAGTIPVTGVGQPVGKVLDKSGRGNHATQSTSAKRPILQKNATTGAYYLAFDGVDDCLVTGNLDLSSGDKVSLFSGLRKLVDGNTAVVFETSTSNTVNSGAFRLSAPGLFGSAKYIFSYLNSHVFEPRTQDPLFSAPNSAVVSVKVNSTSSILCINAKSIQEVSDINATGNLGNYPMYIGMRAGTSLPFSGHLYSLIGIARLATTTEITNTENAIAKNVGVTL